MKNTINSTTISFPDNHSGSFQTYSIFQITKTSFGCIDSISKPIYIATRPIVSFVVTPDSACGPDTSTITNNSQYATNYLWTTSHTNIKFSNDTAFEPLIYFPENKGVIDSNYDKHL